MRITHPEKAGQAETMLVSLVWGGGARRRRRFSEEQVVGILRTRKEGFVL